MITTYECRDKELAEDLIKQARSLSLPEISRLLGCTVTRACHLLKGKVSMRLSETLVLSRMFGVSLDKYVTVRRHEFDEIFRD